MNNEYSINELLEESIKHGLVMAQGEEPFEPFMNLITENGPMLSVLVADDIEMALASASSIIERQESSPLFYSIVWDGRVTIDDEKTDSLLIEIGDDSSATAQVIAQPYIGNDPATRKGGYIGVQNTENRITACKKVGPFSVVEWDKLSELPVSLFILVAGADGEIDDKEMAEFTKLLNSPSDFDDAFSALLLTTANNYRSIITDVHTKEYSKWTELESAKDILEFRLDDDALLKFKTDLYQFSKSIASSSGGFFGFGNKIDKSEQAVLDRVKAILEV